MGCALFSLAGRPGSLAPWLAWSPRKRVGDAGPGSGAQTGRGISPRMLATANHGQAQTERGSRPMMPLAIAAGPRRGHWPGSDALTAPSCAADHHGASGTSHEGENEQTAGSRRAHSLIEARRLTTLERTIAIDAQIWMRIPMTGFAGDG